MSHQRLYRVSLALGFCLSLGVASLYVLGGVELPLLRVPLLVVLLGLGLGLGLSIAWGRAIARGSADTWSWFLPLVAALTAILASWQTVTHLFTAYTFPVGDVMAIFLPTAIGTSLSWLVVIGIESIANESSDWFSLPIIAPSALIKFTPPQNLPATMPRLRRLGVMLGMLAVLGILYVWVKPPKN